MKKGPLKIRIPNPHQGSVIDVSLIVRMLRQAGISDEGWDNA